MYHKQLSKKLIEKIFKTVPGFIQKPEGILLYNLAKSLKGTGAIVELGSWKGRSTVFLGLGSKNGSKRKIYAIDHFKGDGDTGYKNTFPEFIKNISRFKITRFISPIQRNTSKASLKWKKPISLLFIDASHKYKDVYRDFIHWEPFVTKGGIIALHDTFLDNGPRQLLENIILPKSKWKIISFVESITVLEKVRKLSNLEKLSNYFKFYLRDISYFFYLNLWPLRKMLARLNLYHEKTL